MRNASVVAIAASFLCATLLPSDAAAQNAAPAPIACRDTTCRILFDWGGGRTASSFPHDRRYGMADDFEVKVRSSLGGRGLRLTDDARPGEVVMTLRPTVKSAMCDAMPGTNTDMSCNTISDLQIVFSGGEAAMKLPGGRTVRNRCGDKLTQLTMSQFGLFTADLIAFAIEGEKKGERRPAMQC